MGSYWRSTRALLSCSLWVDICNCCFVLLGEINDDDDDELHVGWPAGSRESTVEQRCIQSVSEGGRTVWQLFVTWHLLSGIVYDQYPGRQPCRSDDGHRGTTIHIQWPLCHHRPWPSQISQGIVLMWNILIEYILNGVRILARHRSVYELS